MYYDFVYCCFFLFKIRIKLSVFLLIPIGFLKILLQLEQIIIEEALYRFRNLSKHQLGTK